MPRTGFIREWWKGLRPHAVQISIDVGWTLLRIAGELLVSLSLLLSFWIFHWAGERLFRAGSWGQIVFDFVHLVGAVGALGLFTGLFLHEVLRFHRRHGGGGGN